MRRTWLVLPFLLCTIPLEAHDFWLQPSRFWVAPAAKTPLTILVGHGPARQNSPMTDDRVVAFQSVGPRGRVNRKAELHMARPGADAELAFAEPGTHVLLFASNYAPSNLPDLRFNDYLKEEGLIEAIRIRQKNGTTDAPGRELYSRRAKALIQVGRPGPQAQPQVTSRLGLSLEIVPERNPYTIGASRNFPVRVFFEGRPLAGALVKMTDLDADEKPVETHLTDQAGRAVFKARRQGQWQMNVVWSKPLASNRQADFATTFSSLTFGFPARAPAR